jgi:ribosomal protein S18 acetylase RimI-like enzyme
MKETSFFVKVAQGKEDMDFFFRLSFETLKTLRRPFYDKLVQDNLGKSDDELFLAHVKENEEYANFSSPKTKVFIAEDEEGVRCGYLWIGERNSRDPWDLQDPQWIYDIVVVPNLQGQGLGRKLMAKAEEFAIEQERNLGLFVHADNSSALTLYEKTGFKVKAVPISRKLDSTKIDSPAVDGISIVREKESDRELTKGSELQRFTRRVEFSKSADEKSVIDLFDEHSKKYAENPTKNLRLLALTKTGELAGMVWAGVSDFNEKIVMIYELLIDIPEMLHELAEVLELLVDRWAQEIGCTVLYILHHTEDDLDLDFFKSIGYSVPGYFMEKRLVG